MRKTILVILCIVCAPVLISPLSGLISLTGNSYVIAAADALSPVSLLRAADANAEDYDKHSSDVPTSGGKPVFATRADVMISSAESFIESKDYDSAEKIVMDVTEKYPDYVPGWLLLGYCRSLIGRYEDSNEAYTTALDLGADPRTVQTRTAYNFMKLKEWLKARNCYLNILEIDPTDTGSLTQLGFAETKLGNSEKALFYYEKALEIEPKNTSILYAASKILIKLGSAAYARELLERASAIEPDNSKYLKKIASLHLQKQEYKQAAVILKRIDTLDPDSKSNHRNLGVAFYELGNKRGAKLEFERYETLGGDMKGLTGPLAECCYETGEAGKAIKYIKNGIERGDQQAWLYSIWGKMLEKNKNYNGAISKFSKAASLHEEPWSSYARQQIVRQRQLKKREEMLAKQAGGMSKGRNAKHEE